jgi:hypothetical protein
MCGLAETETNFFFLSRLRGKKQGKAHRWDGVVGERCRSEGQVDNGRGQ